MRGWPWDWRRWSWRRWRLGAQWLSPWWLLAFPLAAFVMLAMLHDGVRAEARAGGARGTAYSERALDRLENKWAGKGPPGRAQRSQADNHLYADDLDVLGEGSLFELLNVGANRKRESARWRSRLLEPAVPAIARARQAAVEGLGSRAGNCARKWRCWATTCAHGHRRQSRENLGQSACVRRFFPGRASGGAGAGAGGGADVCYCLWRRCWTWPFAGGWCWWRK